MSETTNDPAALIQSLRAQFASARRHGDPYTLASTPALLALFREYDRLRAENARMREALHQAAYILETVGETVVEVDGLSPTDAALALRGALVARRAARAGFCMTDAEVDARIAADEAGEEDRAACVREVL